MSKAKRHTAAPRSAAEERRAEIQYRVILGVLAAAYFIAMCLCSGQRDLLIDEVYQLDFCMHHGYLEVLTLDPYACPLFTAVAYPWYHIVPYGALWLRILPIAMVTGALLLTAGCGRVLGGRRCGALAMLFACLALYLGTHAAINFRPYGLYALAGAWIIYLYLRRIDRLSTGEKITWKSSVLFGVAMATLGYTHYLGLVFCALFFLADLALLFAGKLKGNKIVFLGYAVAVVLYLPWAIFIAYDVVMERIAPAVQAAGDPEAMEELDSSVVRAIGKSEEELDWTGMVSTLCGSKFAMRLFYFFSAALVLFSAYKARMRTFTLKEGFAPLALMVFVYLMLTPFYILLTRTEIITTFWVSRYFMVLIPCIVLTVSFTLNQILKLMPARSWIWVAAALVIAMPLGYHNIQSFWRHLSNGDAAFYEPFERYLTAQPDIEDDEVAWLTYSASKNRTREISVWLEYIFNRDGQEDWDINVIDGNDRTVKQHADELLQYEKIYFSIMSNNFHIPRVPQSFRDILENDYVMVETYYPNASRHHDEYLAVYVRNDVYEAEHASEE